MSKRNQRRAESTPVESTQLSHEAATVEDQPTQGEVLNAEDRPQDPPNEEPAIVAPSGSEMLEALGAPAELVQAAQAVEQAADESQQPTPDTGASAMLQAAAALIAATQQAMGTDQPQGEATQEGTEVVVKMHGGFDLSTLPRHIQAIAKREEKSKAPPAAKKVGPNEVVLVMGSKVAKSRCGHGAAWVEIATRLCSRKHEDGSTGATIQELLDAGVPGHNITYQVKNGWLARVQAPAEVAPEQPKAPEITAAGAAQGLENLQAEQTHAE